MLLITRPEPDGTRTAKVLKKQGFDSLVQPMMRIELNPHATIDPEGVQAFVVTSANGARAFAAATDHRDMKVFAVGSATAEMLAELGFVQVSVAGGDVQSLGGQLIKSCDPAAGRLVHIAASQQAGDLSGLLKVAGFRCDKAVLYSAVAATELSPVLIEKLEKGEISGVLFYSPRTAAIFTGLIEGAAAGHLLKPVTAWCLSKAVAEKLDGRMWQAIRVADQPDQQTLFALLSQPQTERAPQMPQASRREPQIDTAIAAGEKPVSTKKTEQPEPAVPIMDKPVGRGTADAKPPTRKKSSFGLVASLLVIVFFMGMAAWPVFYPQVKDYLPAYVGDIVTGRASAPDGDILAAINAENAGLKRQITLLDSQMMQISADLEAKISKLAAPEMPDVPISTDIRALVDADIAAMDEKIQKLRAEVSAGRNRMTARLEQQSQKLDQMAALPQPSGAGGPAATPSAADPSPAIDEMKAEIDGLTGRLADALARLTQAEQSQADGLAAQSARLQAMDAKLLALPASTANSETAALALGLGRLRRDVDGGDNYADSLALFRISSMPSIQAPVAALATYADTGVAPAGQLKRDFAVLADELVHTARLPDDDGWVGKTLSTIAASIKFRPTGDATGDDTGAIVARAEVRLKADDLSGALSELAKLGGKPAAMAAPWMAAARSRLAAEAALVELNGIVTDLALQSLQQSE